MKKNKVVITSDLENANFDDTLRNKLIDKSRLIIIYGKNGAGKSTFSSKLKEMNYLVLNSYLNDWYDPTNKSFSEYKFHEKKFKEYAQNISKNLFQIRKSGLKDKVEFEDENRSSFNGLKAFLKQINFIDPIDWLNFYNENSKSNKQKNNQLTIYQNIDLYNNSKKIKEFINNISDDEIEFLKIYLRFSYEPSSDYKNKEAKAINNELMVIKNKLEEKLINVFKKWKDASTLEDLKTLSFDDHDFIFNKTNTLKFNDEYISQIKNKILDTDEFKSIKYESEKLDEQKNNSIKFDVEKNKNNYEIIDNGLAINIDLENKSDGEKIYEVITMLTSTLHDAKKILVLDDFFEKLDLISQQKAILAIAQSICDSDFTFIVLTHDIHTLNLIQAWFKIYELEKYNKQYLITSDTKNTYSKWTFTSVKFNSNFQQLNQTLIDGISKSNENKIFYQFAKFFSRYVYRSAELAFLKNDFKELEDPNVLEELWNFSSECIYHYKNEINYEDYPSIDKSEINNAKNSIDIINYFIKEFNNKMASSKESMKFGLLIGNIISWLNETKNWLGKEKEYYDKWNINNKNDLIEKWKKSNESEWLRRNEHMHSLDFSLIKLFEN